MSPSSKRIGVFGGTFDPIHLGHLRVAEEVRELLGLTYVQFVPAASPPFKQFRQLFPAPKRVEMVTRAIQGNPAFSLNDLEFKRSGPSYTVTTLQEILRESRCCPQELWLLVGVDAFRGVQGWYQFEQLFTLANIAVISRPGYQEALPEIQRIVASQGFCYTGDVKGTICGGTDSSQPVPTTVLPPDVRHGSCAQPHSNTTIPQSTDASSSQRTSLEYPRMRERFIRNVPTGPLEVAIVEVTPFHVSSTDVRRRLKEGRSVRYLVPEAIINLVMEDLHNV